MAKKKVVEPVKDGWVVLSNGWCWQHYALSGSTHRYENVYVIESHAVSEAIRRNLALIKDITDHIVCLLDRVS